MPAWTTTRAPAEPRTPTFFAGDTAGLPPANAAEHTKYLTFPQTHTLTAAQASYDADTGVITLLIPRADVGNPPDGTVLFSGTAFTATSATPQSASDPVQPDRRHQPV